MSYNLNEIAAFLGLTPDTIRYYVREGLIVPARNAENNYREFSSEDVLKISDIIFYRTMGLSINTIKKIFGGTPVDNIGEVIEESERDLLKKIREYTDYLGELQDWKKKYREELLKLGKFSFEMKPKTLHVREYFRDEEHLVDYLNEEMIIEKEDWSELSLSFFVDLKEEPLAMRRYICLKSNENRDRTNSSKDLVMDPEEYCLVTYALMTDDVREMIDPVLKYADENNIELDGRIYGIERTNYFVEGSRKWICAVYAPLRHQPENTDK